MPRSVRPRHQFVLGIRTEGYPDEWKLRGLAPKHSVILLWVKPWRKKQTNFTHQWKIRKQSFLQNFTISVYCSPKYVIAQSVAIQVWIFEIHRISAVLEKRDELEKKIKLPERVLIHYTGVSGLWAHAPRCLPCLDRITPRPSFLSFAFQSTELILHSGPVL